MPHTYACNRMRLKMLSWPLMAVGLLGTAALLTGGIGGCSFVVDTSTVQCSTDADCLGKGPAFEGNVCLLDKNVCVRSEEYCTTNEQCIRVKGAISWQCDKEKHGCYNLTSTACPNVFGDPEDMANDNVVVLGFPWLSLNNDELEAAQHAMELSRADLKTQGNLPAVVPGGPARPLAWVHCNGGTEIDTQKQYEASVNELMKLPLPMQTGGLLPDFTNYQVQQTIRAGVFVIGFSGVASSFANIPRRTEFYASSSVDTVPYFKTLAALANQHEKTILAKDPSKAGKLKLVIGVPNDPVFSRETVAYNEFFTINGQKFFDAGDDVARLVSLGADFGSTTAEKAAAIAAMSDFKPDIIVLVGQNAGTYPGDYEKVSPGTARYVVTESAIAVKWGFSFGVADTGRILGIIPSPLPTDPKYRQYQIYHKLSYPQDNATQAAYGIYEIGALSAMTIAAIGNQPITGENFGKALKSRFKLDSPNKVGIDNTTYTNAFNALARGETVNFQDYEFAEDGQQVTTVLDTFCAVPNVADTNATEQYKPAGLQYTNATKTVVGTLSPECSPPVP